MLNVLSNPTTSSAIQNSVFQVMSEGSLKAVGRPAFTLMDKNADPEARKYSAVKEFIFQTLSLAFYFALVTPIVKKGGYKALRKMFKDTQPGFEPKDLKAFEKVFEATANNKEERAKYVIPKGMQEALNILGSGVILTIMAPMVVTKVLHPIMGVVDKHMGKNKSIEQKNNDGDTFAKSKEQTKA